MLSNVNYYMTCVLVITTQCRKYEVNEEAHKLYGEDFNSVLQRFRRTPEYLKILNYKLDDLKNTMDRVFAETYYNYEMELEKEVFKMFGQNTTQLRTLRHPFEKIKKKRRNILKSGMRKSGVDELDTYLKEFSLLSIDESKRARDLGYEYFGRCLHAFIENFAAEDTLPMSTQLPGGGNQPFKVTTKHHHEVTKLTETTETESTTEIDYFTTVAPGILRTFKGPHL